MDEIVYNLENQNFDLSNFDYLPAKYILIPILKQTSYDDFDKYYDVTAYIVTKGYIKEKNEKINFNTKHSITYKVLLPFYVNTSLQIEYSESGKEIEVNDIFDTYEDAEEQALYYCSCTQLGAETLHMSNPGDYDYDEENWEDPEYEIIVHTMYIVYFDLPGCEQRSWHSKSKPNCPLYDGVWDGKTNSVLPKLEKSRLEAFPSIID